jgi:hypothetical protein
MKNTDMLGHETQGNIPGDSDCDNGEINCSKAAKNPKP